MGHLSMLLIISMAAPPPSVQTPICLSAHTDNTQHFHQPFFCHRGECGGAFFHSLIPETVTLTHPLQSVTFLATFPTLIPKDCERNKDWQGVFCCHITWPLNYYLIQRPDSPSSSQTGSHIRAGNTTQSVLKVFNFKL